MFISTFSRAFATDQVVLYLKSLPDLFPSHTCQNFHINFETSSDTFLSSTRIWTPLDKGARNASGYPKQRRLNESDAIMCLMVLWSLNVNGQAAVQGPSGIFHQQMSKILEPNLVLRYVLLSKTKNDPPCVLV